jgi:hypothetical protein
MSPPSDGARPVAWLIRIGDSDVWAYCGGDESDADFRGNASGLKYEKLALYTAADYDALRAEVDRWRDRVSVMSEHVQSQIDKTNEQRARAEAAEAKVSRAEIRLMRVKAFRNFCGEEAKASSNGVWSLLVERLDAALNEGDGE